MNRSNQLEERLIHFSVDVIKLCKSNNGSYAAEHLMKQLIRSSSSVALNYAEARSGESTKDFIHKMKLSLKELRESYVNLKIQKGAKTITNSELLNTILKENDELISIFVSSIKTASNKL